MASGKRDNAPREHERKFLVKRTPARLSRFPHALIEQGYLRGVKGIGDEPTEVRLRRLSDHFKLTVKTGTGPSRGESEAPLSPQVARILWPLTRGHRLKK